MASGKLPSVCLLCQQIFNDVFSFSNTGRTLLIRSSIALIIFSLPLGRILKGIWCLKNFQKNFYFYALPTMALFFSWQQCQRRIFWKKIPFLWLKEIFIIYKSSYMCKKSSIESEVKKKRENKSPQTYAKDMLKNLTNKIPWI